MIFDRDKFMCRLEAAIGDYKSGADPDGNAVGNIITGYFNAIRSGLDPEAVLDVTPERRADLQRQRAEARAQRDFALADAIRDQILAAGFEVSDAPVGQL